MLRPIARSIACLLLTVPFVGSLSAADWPAWRHDAARSAVTSESLPGQLFPQWTWSPGANHVAWPEDARLQFDLSYEPIVVGNKLIVASASSNSVTALDTSTGDEMWRYFAGAPVRLAPFAHRGRVYFGADDGNLVCLDVETGSECWTVNAAPTDRLVLGNERLISVWPARGGVVVIGDSLFFTAGVWPFEGCFLCKVKLDGQPPHLTSRLLEDVSPQGYLVAAQGRVLVPGGRGRVTCYDTESLEPISLPYNSSRGTTETHAASSDRLFFHGDAVFDFDVNQQLSVQLRRPLADGDVIYGTRITVNVVEGQEPVTVHEVVALDLAAREKRESKDRRGETVTKFVVPQIWAKEFSHLESHTKAPPRLVLKASQHLYGIHGNRLFVLDASHKSEAASLVWQRDFDSPPTSALAADGKLFVVTEDGTIHCYGPESREPTNHDPRHIPLASHGQWSGRTADLLTLGDARHGYCLVLGAGSGRLVDELLLQSELQLIVLEPDAARVRALRIHLDQSGVCGSRASVVQVDPRRSALPPYLANLIVAEDAQRFGPVEELAKSMYRVLRPYGGSLLFELPDAAAFVQQVRSAELAGAELATVDRWTRLRRVGALPGAANWTHEYGDCSNTLMSQDQRVKAPLGVLWFGGPASHGDLFYNRHYWGPGLTVVEGRMVVQGPGVLTSIDIYTGRILWTKELRFGHGPGRRGTFFEVEKPGFHFVAVPDAVYLVYPDVCLLLDPETGVTRRELRLPDLHDQWGKVRVAGDQLLVTVFREESQGIQPKAIYALDRRTGQVNWRQEAVVTVPLMAVGGERVYSFDGHLPGFLDAWSRRGLTPKNDGHRLLRTFDLATGEELWQRTSDRVATWMSYSPSHDILVVSNKEGVDAMSAKDGNVLWKKLEEAPGFGGHPENVWDKVILSGDQVIDQRGPGRAFEITTGQAVQHIHPVSHESQDWAFTKQGHHCNYAIASPHLLTFRAGTAGYLDRSTCSTGRFNGFRSGCRNSLIPAGGVLNAPNYAHGCSCNYNLFTSLALVHIPEVEMWTYNAFATPGKSIAKLGINLGAPGDRIDDHGTLWMEYPAKADPSATVPIETEGSPRWFRVHSSQINGAPRWVGGCGVEGLRKLKITFSPGDTQSQLFDVRLYFLEPLAVEPRKRVFGVKLQDVVVMDELDVFQEAGGHHRVLVKDFREVSTEGSLSVELIPLVGETLICGVEMTASTTEQD